MVLKPKSRRNRMNRLIRSIERESKDSVYPVLEWSKKVQRDNDHDFKNILIDKKVAMAKKMKKLKNKYKIDYQHKEMIMHRVLKSEVAGIRKHMKLSTMQSMIS